MSMKEFHGVWLPEHEHHLIEWMSHPKNKVLWDGKPVYQAKKQTLAMQHVRSWRTAIDVGAHCGLWSMHMVKKFDRVVAFEPVELHRECFEKNVEGANHVLVPVALGAEEGSVAMHTTHGSSGDSWVAGAGDIPLKTLDSFGFNDVDFIKLDCEGYELNALRGGEKTLVQCRPTVIVEQKPNRAQKYGLRERQAVEYLQSLGAVLRAEMSGDFVLSWPAQ